VGQFQNLADVDRFVWIRDFPDMAARVILFVSSDERNHPGAGQLRATLCALVVPVMARA
jgi:hypothetical protein